VEDIDHASVFGEYVCFECGDTVALGRLRQGFDDLRADAQALVTILHRQRGLSAVTVHSDIVAHTDYPLIRRLPKRCDDPERGPVIHPRETPDIFVAQVSTSMVKSEVAATRTQPPEKGPHCSRIRAANGPQVHGRAVNQEDIPFEIGQIAR
jgi:hypothetical protein